MSPAVRANVANIANRKGFWLVVQCQNVARSTAMQTTDEPVAAPPVPPSPVGVAESAAVARSPSPPQDAVALPPEIGGRPGPEPTRFGDWEKAGRCIDF